VERRRAQHQRASDEELRRLLIETQRRERWLEAISEIRLSLLGGGSLEEWLEMIAGQVCALADSEHAAILVASENPGQMSLAAEGGGRVDGLLDEPASVQEPIFSSVLSSGATWTSPGAGVPAGSPASSGPLVVAPVTTTHGAGAVLVVSRAAGRAEFDTEDLRMVESFAQQASLALEIARAQGDREQLALIADRERIARDLHDHVIQRLFAVGMSLQAAAHSITDSRALERISDSVEELDATIRDVRSTIFSLELRATERVETSTRSRILDIASMASDGLGFQPRLQFDGPVDTRVPEEMVPDLLAVVREALSNTTRHASASTVEVRVEVHHDLVLTVTDDGVGPEGATRSSGLANMRARAESRDGSMSIGPADGRGTRIEWRVPLPR